MNNKIKLLEQEQMKHNLINLKPGYFVSVKFHIFEDTKKRIQLFDGTIIAIRNRGLQSSFTIRKQSNYENTERIFQIHSPNINLITILKKGIVKKAKLYYLRKLIGKSAIIKEKF